MIRTAQIIVIGEAYFVKNIKIWKKKEPQVIQELLLQVVLIAQFKR
jgi:hypothetical protein